jgi:hypothetical protein
LRSSNRRTRHERDEWCYGKTRYRISRNGALRLCGSRYGRRRDSRD